METPKQQFNARVCTSLMDTSAPSATAFVVKLPIRIVRTVPPPEALDMGRDRLRLPSVPIGLKPTADGTRSAPPFGLPKREEQHERTSRRTGVVARSQVDPPQGASRADADRHRRCRHHSPLRLLECMDGPASLASVRPPAALREVCLSRFPGAFAEVRPHRIGDARRRLPETAPAGVFGAAKVGQPAYPPWPHSVCLPEGLAGGSAPSDPQHRNGAL